MRCSAVAPQPRCCARLPPRPSSRLCPRPARRRLALVAPPASSSCSQVLRCRGSGTPARCLPPRCWSSKVLRVYASEKLTLGRDGSSRSTGNGSAKTASLAHRPVVRTSAARVLGPDAAPTRSAAHGSSADVASSRALWLFRAPPGPVVRAFAPRTRRRVAVPWAPFKPYAMQITRCTFWTSGSSLSK